MSLYENAPARPKRFKAIGYAQISTTDHDLTTQEEKLLAAGCNRIMSEKAAGVYKGRPASINIEAVHKVKEEGKGPSEIAKALKIGRASDYRTLA